MILQQIIDRIDRYIQGQDYLPVLVDLSDAEMYGDLKKHYDVGHYKMINVEAYCPDDSTPMMDKLKNDLLSLKETMFLLGLEPFLMLKGRDIVVKELKSLMQLSCAGKLVVITFGCAQFIKKFDIRLFDAGRIVISDAEPIQLPALNFVVPKLRNHILQSLKGINELPKMMILLEDGADSINVITSRRHEEFPNSLFDIEERNSAFQIIAGNYSALASLNEKSGSEAQWTELLNKLSDYESFDEFATQTLGSISNLSFTIERFSTFSDFEKWICFITLKVFGAKENEYLSIVISKSETLSSFITNLFCELLNHSPKDKDFSILYQQRKRSLTQFQEYVDELSSYCKQVHSKEDNALYYLTDISIKEREQVIELLDRYKPAREDIISILKTTYPDLAAYLSPFDTGNDYLNRYFGLYKYCKVTNQLLPEYLEMVNEQAIKRQYNEWLQARSAVIDHLPKEKSKHILYFMDAMGVEFMGLMQEKCFENNLLLRGDVARCELPSITSLNKGFIQEFKNIGCVVKENKKLDDLKHEGQGSYNYENTKLPIHIVEEINIINQLIEQLKLLDANQTAYVIADHGASRLAVINETENKWTISEKGKHCGRCCPKSDIDEKPENATEENEFWCLANYDRFAGGRRANVEVHGGASLEEVAIPIITVVKAAKKILCKLADKKPILVSFKRTANLLLFVEVNKGDVSITVNGNIYNAKQSDVPYHYVVEMPDLKSAGIYKFNVYLDGALIERDLQFEIKKEGANERKFF